jgi:glycosyltransferase involved in cell wall biosynthesis
MQHALPQVQPVSTSSDDQPLRVLCLDIEGGHGGSSRSLYQLLRHIDTEKINVEVWCRRSGLEQAYADLGIRCHIEPTMPKASSVQRLSRNIVVYTRALWQYIRARAFRKRLGSALTRFDVIHFNIEPLWFLAWSVMRQSNRAATFHVRTNLVSTAFSRFQMRTIDRISDDLIFITENERETFARLATRPQRGHVVYNVVDPTTIDAQPHDALAAEPRFTIACLSNYSYQRGIDRLIELAHSLRAMDVKFVVAVAGDIGLPRSAPGRLGKLGARGGTLEDYAIEQGVADSFVFLGHVSEPERVIAAADLLIKPTRENNPWGRDILEAMAGGVPVASVGTYDRFVESGVTGILQAEFDANLLADEIKALALDKNRLTVMGQAARQRVQSLCDGPDAAQRVAHIWRSAANKKSLADGLHSTAG